MPYSIDQLNQMDQPTFTAALGAIFEQTPLIAEQAWKLRPFQDIADLHQKMVAVVQAMSVAEQYRLIRAHPDLGSKAKMAEASVKEQAGVGLNQLSPSEYEQLQQLNQIYRTRFGFPFIIAVRNYTKASILTALEHRLTSSQAEELQQALSEISEIAYFRLTDIVETFERKR